MRYVIVADVRGKAGVMNRELRQEVYEKFGAKSSTLPAHFTIKAPFEYNVSIEDLKIKLRDFAKREKAEPYQIKGYNHFDRRVIYMDVIMSKGAKAVHDRFIDLLESFPYIRCNAKDGKDKKFHITVASKKLDPIYDQVWEFVHRYPCDFECRFDNITLYRWEETKWVVDEVFELRICNCTTS
ncbi:2'-5' RNA ligase family protein [Anaerosporobacter sp.]